MFEQKHNNEEHFYFAPFGGLPDGERDGIGANSSMIMYKKGDNATRILMDFGVKLPSDDLKAMYPGVSGLIPDFTQFFDTKEHQAPNPVDAVFLTHAHSDHIDGLVYAFMKAKQDGVKMPPIYGSRNTLLTLIDNLKEKNIHTAGYDFIEFKPFKEIKINALSVVPVPVSHTTAESYGFIIHKDRKNGFFNPGDHRSLDSYTSFSGNNEILGGILRKIEMTGMLMDSTSTGIKRDPHTDINLQTALASLQQIFDENPGKQIFTPVISRATENLLPYLLKAKENNKQIFLDGYRLRQAFRRWQELNSFYYCNTKGQLVECHDKKQLQKLRAKGIELYCAEDFRNTVFGYDNIMHIKADNYNNDVSKGKRLVIMSGAFAEKSETERSGAVRLSEGEHTSFQLDKDSVVIFAQRAIKGLNHEGVIEMVNGCARQGAQIYANSFGVHLGDFVTYLPLQPSGHDNADSAYELMKFVMESAKNAKEFSKNHPFYVLGIHGGKDYRQTTADIAEQDNRMKGMAPSNYGVYEYKFSSVTEISKDSLENQRYFAIFSIPQSGMVVMSPVDGNYISKGEDIVIPLDSSIEKLSRNTSQKIRDKALAEEELLATRESNKQRKAEKNKQTFGMKHGSVRKAKKQRSKEEKYSKNKQNKKNAGKIRKYTGRE